MNALLSTREQLSLIPKPEGEGQAPGKLVFGVDPGSKGGIALLQPGKTPQLVALSKHSWPEIAGWLYETVRLSHNGLQYINHEAVAVIEQVSAMPKQGVSSTFKFGEAYGKLQGILTALGIPFERVTPQRWQKSYGLPKKLEKAERKRALKARAQELYPALSKQITLETADALLIAHYAAGLKGSRE